MYYPLLCNVANKIVHDKNAAEDIVQDVFLKLWLKRKELVIHTSHKGYLFQAATNTALNYYAKHKKTIFAKDKTIKQPTQSHDAPLEKLHYKELKGKFNIALNNLPPRCKAIFILSRYEGMKYAQIAEHLQLSVKTVENQMGKALKRLRQELMPFLNKT